MIEERKREIDLSFGDLSVVENLNTTNQTLYMSTFSTPQNKTQTKICPEPVEREKREKREK
jgi:hypothetical protein